MTSQNTNIFVDASHAAAAVPVHICTPDMWESVKATLPAAQQTFAQARGFTGETGQRVQLPGSDGHINAVLFGAGQPGNGWLGASATGSLSYNLPVGLYSIANKPDGWSPELIAVGWGLGAYKFDRYLENKKQFPQLKLSEGVDQEETHNLVEAIHLGRDLINTPAGDMGPEILAGEAHKVAASYGAKYSEIVGEDLLAQNYPMIHAVGRAAAQAPRLVEVEWGDPSHPRLAIVGKGITFDTGGLNIKGAAGARIMKKDMGGAAHALALAKMIMSNQLPIRIHLLLAIAENAISANAYRPGDILTSRAGITVEIDNTDAEGRLVLGDALKRATEDDPVLTIDFATLTGAARVALGPTLPPFFSNRKAPIDDIVAISMEQADPVWSMPLWQPYHSLLASPIADMKNSGGSFAGCVTAALFLERFVEGHPWMHFDVYGWNPTPAAGRPKGGEMFALRALYHWLKQGGLDSDFAS